MPTAMTIESLNGAIIYPTNEQAIAAIRAECESLAVADENDKAGAKACDDARKKVKSLRCEVENRRKELKAGALEFGRNVDTVAKRLTDMLTPIELRLEGQVAIVTEAEKRRKAEAEKALDDRLAKRLDALQAVKAMIPYGALRLMPEAEYAALLAEATEARDKAEAARKAEAERLAILEMERKEAARKQAEQEAENQRLRAELDAARKAEIERERKAREAAEAETRRAEAEKAEAARKAEEEKNKAEQETKAALAEAARKLKETEDQAAAEKAEAERRERAAAEEAAARLREAAEKAARIKAEAEHQARVIEAARLAEIKRQEAEAAAQIADKQAFDAIKAEFPTLDLAWVEIHRLRKMAV